MRKQKKLSIKQEKMVAKKLNGFRTPASGAIPGFKGDVSTEKFLIECKMTVNKSLSIDTGWIKKICDEAWASGKEPRIVISFECLNLPYPKVWRLDIMDLTAQKKETKPKYDRFCGGGIPPHLSKSVNKKYEKQIRHKIGQIERD